jgi:hypothetical protein
MYVNANIPCPCTFAQAPSSGDIVACTLKTVLGMCFIEKEAALSNTDSNSLPRSVKLYSTLTGYSDTILLLIIPSCSSSRRRSVRTFGVIASMFSINFEK